MYEFKKQDAYDFARFMGIKCIERKNKLHFQKCPMCNRSTNDKYTFAINLDTGQFKCLRDSCGYTGNMITLAKDFDFSLGTDVDEYYSPKRKYKDFKTPTEPIKPKPPAVEYLKSRGISEEVCKRYELTTQTAHDNVLVFPFYNEKGKLDIIKYRKTDFDPAKDKNKEWCEANGKPILFGMKQCNLENKTLTITEGQLDSLSVAQAGIENAVSVPTGAKGFTWIPYCWDFVNKFDTIIVFGDHEKGHITLLSEIQQRFHNKRIKHVREEDYKDCKDANDLLRKYGEVHIRTCIENAVDVPLERVRCLADVENVNVYELEKLKTGIKDLDRLLYGGLPFGGIVLVAGKAGKGKSSFASQILANALEQGQICFAYSGELPNHLFKAWLDYQLAGKNHIQSYQTKFGTEGYKISDTNRKQISEWYRDRMLIYDSNAVDDEEISLFKTVEEVITRYGARVILIDNLMTALDLDDSKESDKYERQSKFVKKFARIALQYNVLVILVAHKRKSSSVYETDDNEEVSGSSDITNLCSITLSYDVGTRKEIEEGVVHPTQRKLKLSKNRIFGVVNTDGWVLNFEPKSKRIFGENDNPDYEYGWAKSVEDGFTAVSSDVPFDLPSF